MATGNGAYIVHKELENRIPGYSVKGYSPYFTLMPFSLRTTVNMEGADIVHTTPDHAVFFKKKGIPSIITFHNYVIDSWMGRYSSFLQRVHYNTDLKIFIKLAVSDAHTITAVSQFTADIVKKELGIKKDIQVIYNGVDTNLFSHMPRRNNKKIRVLFSGNISTRKGAHWLPAIAERLSRNIVIYYTSGLRGGGKVLYKSNMESVGSIPYDKMPSFYNTMDIVLMPTVREGFSLAVLEAMACGLPIVATNCSSLSEQVKEGKGGFLCSVGDVDSFADKINMIAGSSKLRHRMGEYNRARVEDYFSMGLMIDKYRKLFEKVESNHNNPWTGIQDK